MVKNNQDDEETTPETVLIETLIVFGLVILMKYLHRNIKSSSILPIAATVALGYYIIMFIVSRFRPCMCKNIRNSVTWALGSTLGNI
jgi:hypothetical protein